MNYTKGEWRVIHNGDFYPWQEAYLIQVNNMVVATIPVLGNMWTRVEVKANAHLIAAAPDMYEELVEANAVICHLCKRVNAQHGNCTSCEDRESRLKAIAKAEGK